MTIASVQSVKLIRDKIRGSPVGYGFVEFSTHEIAKQVYITMNGSPIPGTTRNFKLNWATHGSGGIKQSTAASVATVVQQNQGTQIVGGNILMGQQQQGDFQVYVGDLDPNVNDTMLLAKFQKRYPSVMQAKIIVDPVSRYSKGYGFVKFGNQEEAQRAILEMQGNFLLSKPMKLNYAAQKKSEQQASQAAAASSHLMPPVHQMPYNNYMGGYQQAQTPQVWGGPPQNQFPPVYQNPYTPYAPPHQSNIPKQKQQMGGPPPVEYNAWFGGGAPPTSSFHPQQIPPQQTYMNQNMQMGLPKGQQSVQNLNMVGAPNSNGSGGQGGWMGPPSQQYSQQTGSGYMIPPIQYQPAPSTSGGSNLPPYAKPQGQTRNNSNPQMLNKEETTSNFYIGQNANGSQTMGKVSGYQQQFNKTGFKGNSQLQGFKKRNQLKYTEEEISKLNAEFIGNTTTFLSSMAQVGISNEEENKNNTNNCNSYLNYQMVMLY